MAIKTIQITKEVEESAEEFSSDQSGYIYGAVRQRDAEGNVLAEVHVTLVPTLDIETDPELQDAISTIRAALIHKAQEGSPSNKGRLLDTVLADPKIPG